MSDVPDIGPLVEFCPNDRTRYPMGGRCPQCGWPGQPPSVRPVPIPLDRDRVLDARIKAYDEKRDALQALTEKYYAEKDEFYAELERNARLRDSLKERTWKEKQKMESDELRERQRQEREKKRLELEGELWENQSRQEDGSVTGLFLFKERDDWEQEMLHVLDDDERLSAELLGDPNPCRPTKGRADDVAKKLFGMAETAASLYPEGSKILKRYLTGERREVLPKLPASLFNAGACGYKILGHIDEEHRNGILRQAIRRLKNGSLKFDEKVRLSHQTKQIGGAATDLWFSVGEFNIRSSVDVAVVEKSARFDEIYVLTLDNWTVEASGTYDWKTHKETHIPGTGASPKLGCVNGADLQKLERSGRAKKFDWVSESWSREPTTERVSLSQDIVLIDGYVKNGSLPVADAKIYVCVEGARTSDPNPPDEACGEASIPDEGGYWVADFKCPKGYAGCCGGKIKCTGTPYPCITRKWRADDLGRVPTINLNFKSDLGCDDERYP